MDNRRETMMLAADTMVTQARINEKIVDVLDRMAKIDDMRDAQIDALAAELATINRHIGALTETVAALMTAAGHSVKVSDGE